MGQGYPVRPPARGSCYVHGHASCLHSSSSSLSPAAHIAALCDFKCIEYFRALNDDDATTMMMMTMTMMLPGYVCGYGCGDAEHCVYYHRHGDVSRCVASRSSDLPFVSGLFI